MNKVLTELWDFFKKNFAILLIGALFLIFYGNGCNGKGTGKNTSDTTTTVVQQPQPIIIMPPYQPQQSGATVYIPTPQGYQPVIPDYTIPGLIIQVIELGKTREALAKEYFAVKSYKDSIELRDIAGLKVGVVNLNQTVSENTLKSTQPTYQLSFPLKTVTITNTVYPKAKNQVYIGVGFESQFNNPSVEKVKGGFLFKNKKDLTLGVDGTYNIRTAQPGIQFSLYKKLTFKL